MNILALCDDNGINYNINPSGKWLNINCPLCGDTRYRGGIQIETGHYYCFKCGSHSLPYVLQKKLDFTQYQISKLLTRYESDLTPIIKTSKITGVQKIDLPGEALKKIHRKYLLKRNFDPDKIIKKYKITGTVQFQLNFSFRFIIPFFQKRNLVSFIGCNILSPSESVVPHNYTLYGQQFARGKQIAVVEGVIDQWNMGDGFVAVYGSTLSDMQLYLLAQYETVFFIFDSDALHKAKKYAQLLAGLNNKINVEFIDLELKNGYDGGDLAKDEVRYIRKELNFMI